MRLLPLALFLAACLALPASVAAAEQGQGRPWRVFILHSYDPDYIWTSQEEQGIRAALRGRPCVFEVHHLDVRKRPGLARKDGTVRETLARIEAFDPDVVIATDDAAQAWVVQPHLAGRERPQVFFCGVNAPPSDYGFPGGNVSGVRERYHYREGFELLRRIAPGATTAVFLADSSDTSGHLLRALREECAVNGRLALQLLQARTVKTFQQWQAVVRESQPVAGALALGPCQSLVDEGTGAVVPVAEVMDWTVSVNRLPTLGFTDGAARYEILCGVLESAQEQGFLAGSMAAEALATGRRAGEMPLRVNEQGTVLVNLRAAARLSLNMPFEVIEAAGTVVE